MFKKLMAVTVFMGLMMVVAGSAHAKAQKVDLCHATSSEHTPYVLISVSVHALDTHLGHHDGDFVLPDGATDCSGGGPMPG